MSETQQKVDADPVLVEIVAGTLAAIEREVETSIGRTSRSPMIRDAHDFRAGIHDRQLRKLTGRSYSALVHPVVRDHPIATMHPGDVFFHNDVYLSEGGADRAVTGSRPVFFDDWVETPTYDRPRLAPGDVVPGPAVIEEFGSTVPVHPGFRATVDLHGNLLIERNAR